MEKKAIKLDHIFDICLDYGPAHVVILHPITCIILITANFVELMAFFCVLQKTRFSIIHINFINFNPVKISFKNKMKCLFYKKIYLKFQPYY